MRPLGLLLLIVPRVVRRCPRLCTRVEPERLPITFVTKMKRPSPQIEEAQYWDDDDASSFESRSRSAGSWSTEHEPIVHLAQLSDALGVPVESMEEQVVDRPWGGTGDTCIVCRVYCQVPSGMLPVICKRVLGPSRRHEANASYAHIKSLSYKVELEFLRGNAMEGIASALLVQDFDQSTSLLILTDLVNSGYPRHVTDLSLDNAHCALRWLADFHKAAHDPNLKLWRCGGYWALDKRMHDLGSVEANWERLCATEPFRGLPVTLGARLVRSAHAVARVLYPHLNGELQLPRGCDDGQAALGARLLVRAGALAHPRRLQEPVRLHGDFKAENVFFADDGARMAAIDFQWVGLGVGAIDVLGLLSTSLGPDDALSGPRGAENETALLTTYVEAFGHESLPLLRFLFDVALVDFCRYIVGSGDVFEEDVWMLRRAHAVLQRAERSHGYDEGLRALWNEAMRG